MLKRKADARGNPFSANSALGHCRRCNAGFTLIEVLTVTFIILILASLLLTALSKVWKKSQIAAMKFNFHTISDGLENYKSDFGAYPMNGCAQTDYLFQPRTDASLAMALLGPGPACDYALTQPASFPAVPPTPTGYTKFPDAGTAIYNGDCDGADGQGFKTQYAVYATGTASGSPPSTTITVSGLVFTTGGTTLPTITSTTPSPLPFTVVSFGAGTTNSHVPIWGVPSGGSSSGTITLAYPLQPDPNYPSGYSNMPITLLTPVGKTWGPYLPVDKFKVAYFNVSAYGFSQNAISPAAPYEPAAMPVLLDTWGGPIYYFPRFNKAANNLNSASLSKVPANVAVTVGPLLGSPSGITTKLSVITSSADFTGNAVFWDGLIDLYYPGGVSTSNNPWGPPAPFGCFTAGQRRALLYKLGDTIDPSDYSINPGGNANTIMCGVITSPGQAGATWASGAAVTNESLAVELPYFLLCAGPDGQFTDLYGTNKTAPYASEPTTPNLEATWSQTMQSSGNIYSFDQ